MYIRGYNPYKSFRIAHLVCRLQNDRSRHEQLARDRLEQMRNNKRIKQNEEGFNVVEEGPVANLQEPAVTLLEWRHELEREVS